LGTSIISLAKHWCNIKGGNYVDSLQIILSTNVDLLPVQIQEQNQKQMHPKKGTCLEEQLNWLLYPILMINIMVVKVCLD
jgi:hypothetical protein